MIKKQAHTPRCAHTDTNIQFDIQKIQDQFDNSY